MKLKEIKELVKIGVAKEIKEELSESVTVLKVSKGVYGMNGALLQGDKTKQLYAITARNTLLFRYV